MGGDGGRSQDPTTFRKSRMSAKQNGVGPKAVKKANLLAAFGFVGCPTPYITCLAYAMVTYTWHTLCTDRLPRTDPLLADMK